MGVRAGGRTLANVDARQDGQLIVSPWLVEQGWARVYEAYPMSESDDARALQAAAQQAGRGMWATCTAPGVTR